MVRAKVKMYGALWCGDCLRAKQFFNERDIPYEWIDVQQNPEQMKFVEKVTHGMRSIPTIVFEDGSILVEPTNAELAAKVA